MDNNLHMIGREKTEQNELLNSNKSLAIKHEIRGPKLFKL